MNEVVSSSMEWTSIEQFFENILSPSLASLKYRNSLFERCFKVFGRREFSPVVRVGVKWGDVYSNMSVSKGVFIPSFTC